MKRYAPLPTTAFENPRHGLDYVVRLRWQEMNF
jgi:hypothetical protein